MPATKAKGRMGRPMGLRAEKGYDADLSHLRRLLSACFDDTRITAENYDKISSAVTTISTLLRRLPHT